MFHMSFHKTWVKLAWHPCVYCIPQSDRNPIFRSYQYLEIIKEAPEYNSVYFSHIYQLSSGYHNPYLFALLPHTDCFLLKTRQQVHSYKQRAQLFDTSEPFLVFFNHCLQHTCLLSYIDNFYYQQKKAVTSSEASLFHCLASILKFGSKTAPPT